MTKARLKVTEEDFRSLKWEHEVLEQRFEKVSSSYLSKRNIYCIDPKFSDRQALANSADPDQTAPRSSLIRVYTVCHSIYIFLTSFSMEIPLFEFLG